MTISQQSFYAAVLKVIQSLPEGSVTTYGELAKAAGRPNAARQIGNVLYTIRRDDPSLYVPWWRVVNAAGKISIAEVSKQQKHLEDEGVVFSSPGVIENFHHVRFPVDLLRVVKD